MDADGLGHGVRGTRLLTLLACRGTITTVCVCAGWMGEGGGVCVCVGITAQRLCKCDHPPTPHPSPQFYQKYMNTHLMCNNVKVQGRPTSRGLIWWSPLPQLIPISRSHTMIMSVSTNFMVLPWLVYEALTLNKHDGIWNCTTLHWYTKQSTHIDSCSLISVTLKHTKFPASTSAVTVSTSALL